jgi:hypothetical protein
MSCSSNAGTIFSGMQVLDCLQPEIATLERVNYFNRQLLTADDMITERDYFVQKMRRHNRFLHGWGVVCGLLVKASPAAGTPWQVQIGAGYALGPYGDEIYVAQPVLLDLAKCGPGAATDPCEPSMLVPGTGGIGARIYVAIKYAECFARPVRAMPPGCGCDDDPCEYSRIRDSFQVQCLTQLPPSPVPGPTLCDILRRGFVPLCPPCPDDPWVVLAMVNLPVSPSMNISDSNINNASVRRLVFSTAVLQDQLIRCCCGGQPSSSSSSSSSSSVARTKADLSVTQTFALVPRTRRSKQITVTVTNKGPGVADNVVLDLAITPPPASAYNLKPDAGWTVTGEGSLEAALGLMMPGAQLTRTVVVSPVSGIPARMTLSSNAQVSSPTPEADITNNSSTIDVVM